MAIMLEEKESMSDRIASDVINAAQKVTNEEVVIEKPRQTISLCMIVRDEEKYLRLCLESAKFFVDEIIVVDTGSVDNTVEIARRYTDKVYFHEWENDFSKARNQSISYATMDWIFILDADEELVEPLHDDILKNVPDTITAMFFSVESKFDNGINTSKANSIRFFRRDAECNYRYEGIVHNALTNDKKQIDAYISQAKIIHHGYNDNTTRQKKHDRTVALLKKQIELDPKNPSPWHYLANSYLSIRGMDKECVKAGLKAAERFEDHEDRKSNVCLHNRYTLSVGYMRLANYVESERWALLLLAGRDNHLDGFLLLSDVYMATLQLEKCICYSEKYLALLDAYNKNTMSQLDVIYNTIGYSFKAHVNAAIAYKLLGNVEGCNKHNKVMLSDERRRNLLFQFVCNWFFHSPLKINSKGEL